MSNNVKTGRDAAGGIWVAQGELRARILPFGASLQDLRMDGVANPLVLSLPDVAYSGAQRMLYSGAVVGRVAGRIGQAGTVITGAPIKLDANEGPHHLHGGATGFSHCDWTVTLVEDHAVTLSLTSEAGEGGYPGRVSVTARYEVLEGAVLSLTLEARSDADTLLNLCHHPYFNLSGAETIADHELQCVADQYLPCDAAALPTGEIADVADTAFDFRSLRAIADTSYDNSLCLHRMPCGPLAHAATLSAVSGPVMEIWTTQPGLHIYDGAGISGQGLAPRAALAIEAQGWPDAPNKLNFPSVALAAGEVYRQTTQYRFTQ